jgi:hypothetical protein
MSTRSSPSWRNTRRSASSTYNSASSAPEPAQLVERVVSKIVPRLAEL